MVLGFLRRLMNFTWIVNPFNIIFVLIFKSLIQLDPVVHFADSLDRIVL